MHVGYVSLIRSSLRQHQTDGVHTGNVERLPTYWRQGASAISFHQESRVHQARDEVGLQGRSHEGRRQHHASYTADRGRQHRAFASGQNEAGEACQGVES